jgi:hypothetical protein
LSGVDIFGMYFRYIGAGEDMEGDVKPKMTIKVNNPEIVDAKYIRKKLRWFWRWKLDQSPWKLKILRKVLRVWTSDTPQPNSTKILCSYTMRVGGNGKKISKKVEKWIKIKIQPKWMTPIFLKLL